MTIHQARMAAKKRETVKQVKKMTHGNKRVNRKRCPRTELRRSPQIQPIQKLFRACTEIFKGPGTVPPPRDVEKLQSIIDDMKPEDVGLSSEMSFFKASNEMFFKPENGIIPIPRVKYSVIYQCKNFEICMFFLPPTAVIPLHNHPGMTVFNKLLIGSMHVKAYDWVDPYLPNDLASSPEPRLAKMKANEVFAAPRNTSVLYPTSGGNMHEFTAVTPCLFLDVLGPPYCLREGRDCTYYKEFPYSSFTDAAGKVKEEEAGGYGWLKETEIPRHLKIEGIQYMGPPIVERDV